ncbi:hypothetical protein FHL15_001142 [Xylaria flabelliformis]|uniref:Uncharacterized protein n=1 Tax=Xylaria flabelliformis TaxID=2512241 RepID=A0A553ICK3_9PEZI|nr:hypothetical protein FHL15_001142 [Xylaria flabelliformis]
MELDGSAFVIGGGGIGKACAVAFAKEGASGVMIADIDLESAALAAAECRRVSERPDFRAEITSIDVTCESSVKKAVAQTVMRFGRVGYCVICAGVVIQQGKETSLADATDFDRFLDVNVKGTFLATRDVSAAMKLQEPRGNDEMGKRGHSRGAIVIMGSVSSFLPQPRQIQYTASKHAVLGIAKKCSSSSGDRRYGYVLVQPEIKLHYRQ